MTLTTLLQNEKLSILNEIKKNFIEEKLFSVKKLIVSNIFTAFKGLGIIF